MINEELEPMFTKLEIVNIYGFLTLLEWTRDNYMSPRCVHCEQTKESGHLEGCDLADLISVVKLKMTKEPK